MKLIEVPRGIDKQANNQTNINKDVRIVADFFWVPFLFYTNKFDVENKRSGRSSITKATAQWPW